jgi:hypothetical protein
MKSAWALSPVYSRLSKGRWASSKVQTYLDPTLPMTVWTWMCSAQVKRSSRGSSENHSTVLSTWMAAVVHVPSFHAQKRRAGPAAVSGSSVGSR